MANHVVNLAQLECSFGNAPSVFTVLPANKELSSNQPAANIMDYVPILNIKPFGQCNAPTNPAYIATKAVGAPDPPCVPLTTSPWIVGAPTVLLANMPALNDTAMCLCTWLGQITVTDPGETTHEIPD